MVELREAQPCAQAGRERLASTPGGADRKASAKGVSQTPGASRRSISHFEKGKRETAWPAPQRTGRAERWLFEN